MEPRSIATAYPELGIELRVYHELVQPFAAHSHDGYVIGHVIEGSRDMVCDGKDYRVLPGDLLAFNPGEVHSCTQHGEDPLEYVSVLMQANVAGWKRLQGPIVRSVLATQAFDGFASALRAGGSVSEQRQLLQALLAALSVEGSKACEESTRTDIGSALAAAECAQHSLRAHVARHTSLDSLADEQGLSKFQLLRAYKKRYAITPLAHLSSFKIERACELLAKGIAPAEIAMQLGFADQAHLTRVFKQQIGMTPKAYQRMIAESAGASR